jgi:hypothetical protein
MAHFHYLNDYTSSTAIDIQRDSLSLSHSLWIYLERESSVIGYTDGG